MLRYEYYDLFVKTLWRRGKVMKFMAEVFSVSPQTKCKCRYDYCTLTGSDFSSCVCYQKV
jgi:hypothetical protein